MAITKIFAPHLNRHVHVGGRTRPVAHSPHMKASRYLGALPPPPAAIDYSPAASQSLSLIYGNDTMGDCVIAEAYHFYGLVSANAGKQFIASPAQIIGDYAKIGGYVPGNPATDNGCDMQAAMNYYMTHGYADGTKLLGWLAVDPANKLELQQVIYLFEGLSFGMDLPDAWITPFPSGNGFVWDKATINPNNGHAFLGYGYNPIGVNIDTWGLFGTLTYDAIATVGSAVNGGDKTPGSHYFDLTVLKPVYWNGAAWTDAVGTAVP